MNKTTNIKIQKKESFGGFKGVYTFTKAFLTTKRHFELNDQITLARDSGNFEVAKKLIAELHSICKTKKMVWENVVPTVAKAMVANNFMNVSPTNLMRVKYAEVGTGTTAPVVGDVALETPTYRNVIASITNASNVGFATAFFNATEMTGTLKEAGIFSDGSITIGTGVLVSRVAINITKSNTETLTLDWELTIS